MPRWENLHCCNDCERTRKTSDSDLIARLVITMQGFPADVDSSLCKIFAISPAFVRLVFLFRIAKECLVSRFIHCKINIQCFFLAKDLNCWFFNESRGILNIWKTYVYMRIQNYITYIFLSLSSIFTHTIFYLQLFGQVSPFLFFLSLQIASR